MSLPKLWLKPHHDERIRKGHLWVFSNEVERLEGSPDPGGGVDVFSANKKFLGRGFYNPHSLICARILTHRQEEINPDLIGRKLSTALALRSSLYPGDRSYRLVFGESDGLPGLVIDRMGTGCVIQSYCLGMDVLMPMILEALVRTVQPEWIVLKNDSQLRALENLPSEVKVAAGQVEPPVELEQRTPAGPARFWCDPLGGQKTGFFFDQRGNREAVAKLAKGKRVLDCFAYVGAFSVYAGLAGAATLTAVDSSAGAGALARKNLEANGLRGEVLQQEVEEALESFRKQKIKFDIIVLDPPALAKSKKNIFGALRKYAKLNSAALSVLEPGGILASCSCSHHVGRKEFVALLGEAASDAGRTVQILEMRGQAQDHPILPSMPETEYLKCAILKAD